MVKVPGADIDEVLDVMRGDQLDAVFVSPKIGDECLKVCHIGKHVEVDSKDHL